MSIPADLPSSLPAGQARVGIDTVSLAEIQSSLARFGRRFVARLFTDAEQADVQALPHRRGQLERLGTRFAAKEAAIKALGLAELGLNWRDLEVVRQADGQPRLTLHGRAREHAQRLGVVGLALSMSHDGDQACAVVWAWTGA